MTNSIHSPGVIFEAYLQNDINNVTGDFTSVPLLFDTVVTQVGCTYNAATGAVNVTVPGIFSWYAVVKFNGIISGANAVGVNFNGSFNTIVPVTGSGAALKLIDNTLTIPAFVSKQLANSGDGVRVSANVNNAASKVSGFSGGGLTRFKIIKLK